MDPKLTGLYLQQIQIFLTVAKTNNFSQAGELLHLTQPAVSRSIDRLEKELGFPLFQRTTRRVEITPAGQKLLDQWIPALELMSAGYTDALQAMAEESDTIRVGIADSADQYMYFWPQTEQFLEQHPELNCDVDAALFPHLLDMLMARQFDVIFLPDFERFSLDANGIPWAWSVRTNADVIIPYTNHLFHRDSVTLEDICHERFTCLSDELTPNYKRWFNELFRGCSHIPEVVKTYSTPNALASTYRPSDNLLLIADHFLFFSDAVRCKRIPITDHQNGIIHCWRPGPQRPIVQQYIEHMIQKELAQSN